MIYTIKNTNKNKNKTKFFFYNLPNRKDGNN